MNFKQLVFRNVIRNGRAYASYFLSSLFSVMAFFIFALLFFHPALNKGTEGSSETIAFFGTIGMKVAQVVIVLMSFVFLWYTFSVFLKARKRDFSIYLILGMSEKNLRQMIFLENTLLGSSSITLGILIGTFFSKLILLVSQNMLAIENGLDFYFPMKPILLTFVVYLLLFMIISLVTTFTIKVANLTEMAKADETPMSQPKTTWYYALSSFVLIAFGYGAVLKFVFDVKFNLGYAVTLLLLCVLLTIAGTFVFFQQNSIRIFSFLQGRDLFYKRVNMLTITNLVHRMKVNGTMYFMISIVATVAFVGIGTTMSIGGEEFASTQESSFAYTYVEYDSSEKGQKAHEKNLAFIDNRIKKEGYQSLNSSIQLTGIFIEDEQLQNSYVGLIPESQYNKIAEFMGEEKILTSSDNQLIIFATTNTSLKEIKNSKDLGKSHETQATLGISQEQIPISYVFEPKQFNLEYNATAVVSDKFYEKVLAADKAAMLAEGYDFSPILIHIIHFNEWSEKRAIDSDIRQYLDEHERLNSIKMDEVYREIGKADPSEYNDAENEAIAEANAENFHYTSLYKTWNETRQANGMILLISVLLGSVFFTFAACIIYFRLFGELANDGKYHRSLHILGIPRKARHQIVTSEMLIMYFVPVVVAMLHFAVAMYALSVLIELPVFSYYWQIIGAYVVFQLIFFVISRWRYLHHLDYRAEKN